MTMEKENFEKIVSEIRNIISDVAPDAKEKTMYGGRVYELDFIKPKRLFCGIFVRKDYITIEFDRGTELKDDKKFLEGTGKNRRHLTIHSLSEIKSKKVENFIKQSYKLPI